MIRLVVVSVVLLAGCSTLDDQEEYAGVFSSDAPGRGQIVLCGSDQFLDVRDDEGLDELLQRFEAVQEAAPPFTIVAAIYVRVEATLIGPQSIGVGEVIEARAFAEGDCP